MTNLTEICFCRYCYKCLIQSSLKSMKKPSVTSSRLLTRFQASWGWLISILNRDSLLPLCLRNECQIRQLMPSPSQQQNLSNFSPSSSAKYSKLSLGNDSKRLREMNRIQCAQSQQSTMAKATLISAYSPIFPPSLCPVLSNLSICLYHTAVLK